MYSFIHLFVSLICICLWETYIVDPIKKNLDPKWLSDEEVKEEGDDEEKEKKWDEEEEEERESET